MRIATLVLAGFLLVRPLLAGQGHDYFGQLGGGVSVPQAPLTLTDNWSTGYNAEFDGGLLLAKHLGVGASGGYLINPLNSSKFLASFGSPSGVAVTGGDHGLGYGLVLARLQTDSSKSFCFYSDLGWGGGLERVSEIVMSSGSTATRIAPSERSLRMGAVDLGLSKSLGKSLGLYIQYRALIEGFDSGSLYLHSLSAGLSFR